MNDNPILRPVEIGAPDGNRTHVSWISSGVLSQLNYGTVREANLTDAVLSRARITWRASANNDGQVASSNGGTPCRESKHLHAATTAKACATDGTPSLWRITDHLRPIEIGVTNRIRTGTNAFTGRDAAVTS
jgi:hypothetical protein